MVRRPMGARERNSNFTLSWRMELVSRRLLLVQLFAPPMQFRHKNVQPIRKRLRQLVLRPYRFAQFSSNSAKDGLFRGTPSTFHGDSPMGVNCSLGGSFRAAGSHG
jgi:hypothetical protein